MTTSNTLNNTTTTSAEDAVAYSAMLSGLSMGAEEAATDRVLSFGGVERFWTLHFESDSVVITVGEVSEAEVEPEMLFLEPEEEEEYIRIAEEQVDYGVRLHGSFFEELPAFPIRVETAVTTA